MSYIIETIIIFASAMKNFLLNIFSILLAAVVIASCSKSDAAGPEGNHIMISGIVTDTYSGKALEDIKIEFQAYPKNRLNAKPVATSETYTNSEGLFVIQVSDLSSTPLRCKVTATDPQEFYQKRETNVIISWKGISFDSHNDTFVVNDCNFQLTRATSSANSRQSL